MIKEYFVTILIDVFNNGVVVGDVKYKVTDSWSEIRSDIYQSVFFAAAFLATGASFLVEVLAFTLFLSALNTATIVL